MVMSVFVEGEIYAYTWSKHFKLSVSMVTDGMFSLSVRVFRFGSQVIILDSRKQVKSQRVMFAKERCRKKVNAHRRLCGLRVRKLFDHGFLADIEYHIFIFSVIFSVIEYLLPICKCNR
jgi:hypothetical protein